MGNPAGMRRDFEKLEQRRLAGAEFLCLGFAQAEVARRVEVHRQSVGRWAEALERGGRRALRKAGRAGRRPRLHPEDLRRVEHGLKRGPQALGYETSLWTACRVAHLIEHRDFMRQQRGRLWLEFLPAYAPELNPVEYLWSHWKQHELPNFCPQSFGQLSSQARGALRRMRRRPTLVMAFWGQAELSPL